MEGESRYGSDEGREESRRYGKTGEYGRDMKGAIDEQMGCAKRWKRTWRRSD